MFRNLYYTYKTNGGLLEKLKTLVALTYLSFKKYFFKEWNKEVNQKISGYRIYAYGYGTLQFLYREIFCSGDYFFKTSSFAPLIFDCGANVGAATIYFKKLFPNARIFAFEPNPHTYTLLKKNIETNQLNDVQIHNVALYDRKTIIPFFISEDIGTLLGSVRTDRGGKTTVNVHAEKLSSFMQSFSSVDLIKMDVEGAESNIVNDLIEANMLDKAEQYIIEYHHNINNDHSALSAFLAKFESQGFDYSIKANFSKINTFQDILIHFYRRKN